ncbi:MAG: hypothetical protein KF854_00825 [Nitrospira sp.]|nr:hypothetical protein [Nitrospira sp.]MBX3513122.1 hypothetical protein [Xanthobacteraceae bacterium]
MILYHFTSEQHLAGIARHGLTVGDVPTDIRKMRGRIGVWFSAEPTPESLGLEGAVVDKKRFRLAVALDEELPTLHRWTDWSANNVTPETITALHSAAGVDSPQHWWIVLGVIPTESIIGCFDVQRGIDVPSWKELAPPADAVPGVPAWRREAWQRQMLKKVRRAIALGR